MTKEKLKEKFVEYYRILTDEKSKRWINGYKIITVIAFVASVIATIVVAVDWWCYDFLEGLLALFVGALASIAVLGANMLIIQFLDNVQVIREKLEK